MNVKRVLLLCAVVFFTVIGFLIIKSNAITNNKKDPSFLPPPSKQFETWKKIWDQGRIDS